ncbi:MAG: lipase [Acidimicrobiales bacterium]
MGRPRWRWTAGIVAAVMIGTGTVLTTPAAPAAPAAPAKAADGAGGGPDGGPVLTISTPVLEKSLACAAGATEDGFHRPVLLVHGTGLTPAQSWAWNYGAVLPRHGYPTCTVTLPQQGLGDIQVAGEYVVYAVDAVAARWRSPVDIIGHSQGGLEPRWALRWWPGLRQKIDHYIGLASPNHGIYAANACADSGDCWPAVWQMTQDSHFLAALNGDTEAPGPTSYTDIYSETDDLVQPAVPDPTSALRGGANVANIAVQSLCPGRYVNHGGMLVDAVVFALVIDTLSHNGPGQPGRIPTDVCARAFMPGTTALGALGGNAGVYTSAVQAFYAHKGVGQEPILASYAR